MSKKYYWLQLKDDFFEQEEIKLIESMDNGKDYIIFYMKILLKSLENAGYLMFKNFVPYNAKMLSTITQTNIDIVEKAIKIFENFGLIKILENEKMYLTEVENMVGSESKWADYKRVQRTSKRLDNVQQMSKACPKMSNECPSILDTREKILDTRNTLSISLSKNEQIQEQKAESDEDKSSQKQSIKLSNPFFTSFEHFVNFMRANYQNKEIIKTQDKYNKQLQIISVSTNGLLYNQNDNQTFQATRAKEIWQSLYGLYLKGELNIEEEVTAG